MRQLFKILENFSSIGGFTVTVFTACMEVYSRLLLPHVLFPSITLVFLNKPFQWSLLCFYFLKEIVNFIDVFQLQCLNNLPLRIIVIIQTYYATYVNYAYTN